MGYADCCAVMGSTKIIKHISSKNIMWNICSKRKSYAENNGRWLQILFLHEKEKNGGKTKDEESWKGMYCIGEQY